ncbi:collagen-like protein [Maribacter sp. 4G9]|uniref:collagen-like protein n=1 Tax=Maribacter sp. 4G9 TaxID=1889777 RepID=UPI000C14D825|nr:collagen-like protein [Maribacter sp. 4G9]PIB38416.1 hypothetical protein BFP75_16035 [Maribacter sp. 4G9]
MKQQSYFKYYHIGITLVLGLMLSLVSCSPEDGTDGVIGPQGEQGLQGEAGQQGPEGTENVTYSPWIVSDFPNPLTQEVTRFTIEAPDLTQGIMDNGIILVFGRDNGGVYQLPVYFSSSNGQIYTYAIDTPGALSIQVTLTLLAPVPALDSYRYVLIDEGAPDTTGKSAKLDYSKMTYSEIKTLFNIKD